MAFVAIFLGLMLVVTGVRDTYQQLGAQLYKDLAGSGGFVVWIAAVIIIGMIGYNQKFRGFSHAMLALIIIVFIVANQGLFAKLQQALQSGPQQPSPTVVPTPQDIPLHLSGLAGQPIPIKLEGGQGGMGGLGGLGGGGGIGGLAGIGG